MSQTQTPSRRLWTIRAGTTGTGRDLLHTYAETMEEARANFAASAEESCDGMIAALARRGFTVHAQTPGAGVPADRTLAANPWTRRTPAPDFPRELAHA